MGVVSTHSRTISFLSDHSINFIHCKHCTQWKYQKKKFFFFLPIQDPIPINLMLAVMNSAPSEAILANV